VAAIYVAIVAVVVLRGRRDARLVVLAVYAASVLLGGLILSIASRSDSTDEHYNAWILAGLGAGVLSGLVVFAIRRIAAVRLVAAGVLGAPLVPVGFVWLLILALSVSGSCLD
jgi:drug/metabolite transporter (DMT)-like permease